MSTLIRNGLVLLVDGAGWKTEKKDIRIGGNRIVRVGEDLPAEGCTVIDATDRLVIPGLINAHTHAYMTMHRNYADDLAFFDWLDKVQQVEDGMTEEDIYWATLLAIIEMALMALFESAGVKRLLDIVLCPFYRRLWPDQGLIAI